MLTHIPDEHFQAQFYTWVGGCVKGWIDSFQNRSFSALSEIIESANVVTEPSLIDGPRNHNDNFVVNRFAVCFVEEEIVHVYANKRLKTPDFSPVYVAFSRRIRSIGQRHVGYLLFHVFPIQSSIETIVSSLSWHTSMFFRFLFVYFDHQDRRVRYSYLAS